MKALVLIFATVATTTAVTLIAASSAHAGPECLHTYPGQLSAVCAVQTEIAVADLVKSFTSVGIATSDHRTVEKSFVGLTRVGAQNVRVTLTPANDYHFRVTAQNEAFEQNPKEAWVLERLSHLLQDKLVLDLEPTSAGTKVSIHPDTVIGGFSVKQNLEMCELKKVRTGDCASFSFRAGAGNDIDLSVRLENPHQDLDEDDADSSLILRFHDPAAFMLQLSYGNGNDIDDVDSITYGLDLLGGRVRRISYGAKSRQCRAPDRCATLVKSK